MAAPPSLAATLRDHAARHPHRPFLFWPEGLDWRWMAFARAVEAAERPEVGAGAAPPAAEEVLREIAEGDAGSVAAGERLEALLAASDRRVPRPRREVVVLAPPVRREGGLLPWAVLVGAVVVVEPSAAARVATAAWARPTVFRGDAAEVAALAAEAAKAERAGWRGAWRRLRRTLGAEPPPPPPFGRLHTLLLRPPPAGADADLDFWRRRGVAVLADAVPDRVSAAP